MDLLTALRGRLGLGQPEPAWAGETGAAGMAPQSEREGRDPKRLFLLIGLGALSWVATYVGMLELIESNLGDLPLVHKVIIAFSVAMLMVMIIWLLDKMFAPVDAFTRACYIAGYIFLSLISIGFGFGFYWKVLESRGEASRSAESAITQVQSALFAASTRLEQLQSTLDQLTTVSTEKATVERDSGKSCPNSGPGDGPRRKMREDDAARFKFASDFVKGRVGTVKSDMAALDGDLQKIVKDDRSVIDARTGNRNEFLRGVGRKLDLTVTGFNAFRTDPQLRQIRTDLGERAEKTTVTGAKGVTISCPDAQLQMALRGVVRAIDQLPELEKPKIAAVEGSEATIEAFRRLTTTFFGLLSFKLPPSADELRELQKKAVQSVEGSGSGQAGAPQRAAYAEQAAGLAKRDYIPLGVAVFVDLCLLLVSIGRPMNRFVGMERSMRAAETGPVYPILARFQNIHADAEAVRHFAVFQDVIFDVNGHYHVAVPLYVPKHCENYAELKRDAQTLANLCFALEGQGILSRPVSFMPALLVQRQLKRRGSKFVECFGNVRTPQIRRASRALKGLWHESVEAERPAFKVYRFRKGAWPEMILHAVMGAAHHLDIGHGRRTAAPIVTAAPWPDGRGARAAHEHEARPEPYFQAAKDDGAFGSYAHAAASELRAADTAQPPHTNGNGYAAHGLPYARGAYQPAAEAPNGLMSALAAARRGRDRPDEMLPEPLGGTDASDPDVEAERIGGKFAFPKKA